LNKTATKATKNENKVVGCRNEPEFGIRTGPKGGAGGDVTGTEAGTLKPGAGEGLLRGVEPRGVGLATEGTGERELEGAVTGAGAETRGAGALTTPGEGAGELPRSKHPS
jgi:hypothetical protein